jgi:hypothetical protein
MRNPALPLKAVYPEGVPAEFQYASQNVNYIQLPMSANPQGDQQVLIDIYKKQAE